MTNRLWFGPMSRSPQVRLVAAFLVVAAVMIGLGVANIVQQSRLEGVPRPWRSATSPPSPICGPPKRPTTPRPSSAW